MVTNNSFLVELREIPEIVCVTRMCGFANGPCQPENTDPPDADNTCPPPDCGPFGNCRPDCSPYD